MRLALVLLIAWGSDPGLTPSQFLRSSHTLAVADSAIPQVPTPPALAARVSIAVTARAIQPGELVVLTITTPEAATDLHVRAFDRDIPAFKLDPLKWRALIGLDLDVAPGTYAASVDASAGSKRLSARRDLVVRAKRFPTRTLTVDPAFVTPPAEVEARIVREAADLEALWTASSATRLWTKPFTKPVSAAPNSAFGSRSVFNGEARNPHGGADFPSATGTRVLAPNAGRIVLARDLYFSGNTVIIDHGLGLFSTLAHLSAFDVHEGDVVTVGQLVGRVGATGRVTGPHLHWAIRLGGARVDPLALIAMLGPTAK